MISIFNRKELLITYDMKKQSEVRTILNGYRAEYKACEELNQFANNLIKGTEMTIYEKFS